MSRDLNPSKMVFVPFSEASKPPGGMIMHYQDRYWVCCPERGVLFYKTSKRDDGRPQCNPNEEVAIYIRNRLYPDLEVRHIPSVFRRVDLRDYV